ncbi:MAG: hypothetical protein ABMB14_31230 [Myxococcota bacterium]
MSGQPQPPGDEEPPPLLGSWRNLYLAVLGNLAAMVALMWLLTRVWS